MELRHTLEILIKDMQDIEKLVGNLQNSGGSATIELDLALSKLRNVYEVLTLIKADRLKEMISPASGKTPPQVTDELAGQFADLPQEKSADQSDLVEVPAPKRDEANDVTQDSGVKLEGPEMKSDKGIRAEKFSAGSSINENMAGQRKGDQESRLLGQPIDNIHRNIGINDRFLIIRELFNGDADGFGTLLTQLEEAGNLQRATELLKEKFPGAGEHEGIGILEGLIKRRYTAV